MDYKTYLGICICLHYFQSKFNTEDNSFVLLNTHSSVNVVADPNSDVVSLVGIKTGSIELYHSKS